MVKRRSDDDSPWKEIIELFSPQFMAFFWIMKRIGQH